MINHKIFNNKVLSMMIKDNIQNNKHLFLKDNSKEELIIGEKDYSEISNILSKKLEGKDNISIKDIDESIDDYLVGKGYIFDSLLENKYKENPHGNYFYLSIIELNHYFSETSLNDVFSSISTILDEKYDKLCRSTKVIKDIVNIKIVKDNSSRFKNDDRSVFVAGFNLKTRDLILNFQLDELLKLSNKQMKI